MMARASLHSFDASKELGACPPLGYWDPFGMMAFQDEEKFRRNRELELKHGRICMVATIGMIVPDLFGRFGGYLSPSMDLKFFRHPLHHRGHLQGASRRLAPSLCLGRCD